MSQGAQTTETAEANRDILGVVHSSPRFEVPAGACNSHTHVFGPHEKFPLAKERLFSPPHANTDELLALQKALCLDRVVLVQPSPYAADNTCMADALQRLGNRARGVAVIRGDETDEALAELHDLGVRGARANLETLGQNDPEAAWEQLLPIIARIAPLGWHLQLYTNPGVLGPLHDRLLALPVTVVFDHFARVRAEGGAGQPAIEPVLSLLRSGRAYVKFSAPHRISDRMDYADVLPIARAMYAANPHRILWGSDWPHTSAHRQIDIAEISPFRQEDDGRAFNLLPDWVGGEHGLTRVLVDNPAELYGF